VDGTAAVIEMRASERGGVPHDETAVEAAIRMKKAQELAQEREKFLMSPGSVQVGIQESYRLFERLEERAKEITSQAEVKVVTERGRDGRSLFVEAPGVSLSIDWHLHAINVVKGSELEVRHWDGPAPIPGRSFWERPNRVGQDVYLFDRADDGILVWSPRHGGRTMTTEQLAEQLLKRLLERSS
jgi:hypothetical protein